MAADLLRSLAEHWDELSRRDARWAILSDPTRTNERWGDDEFWATGVADVSRVLAELKGLSVDVRFAGRALDFGCGVGRLSRALAEHFATVTGVDVSPVMIDRARAENAQRKNVDFHALESLAWLEQRPPIDFVYSLMTLQHVPRGLSEPTLTALACTLAPRGVLWVQVPERPVRRVSRVRLKTFVRRAAFRLPLARAAWKQWRGGLPLEMYGLSREAVRQALMRGGASLVHEASDSAAGDDWLSRHYIAQRR
jgi:2-polyprenyl-3-methyl-5-hydroxy-6-metoxy-1,4-benzoquinol methylase